jgi:hypothetical protein
MTIATNTADIIPTNWKDKLAVINEFKLSNAAAVEVFHTTDSELATARGLVEKGLLTITPLGADERAKWAPIVGNIAKAKPMIATQTTINVAPALVTKAPTTKKAPIPGAKRGRTGNKIITALNAIPSTPQPIDAFIAAHGISKTVLRQSKRFLDSAIKVSIKKDKVTGVEMICRKA